MTARRVSVVLPTCERPASLRRALNSIRSVEGDDLQFEVIIADNGPSEETRRIATEFGAKYLVVDEKGPSPARNAAMFTATGDYIAFLDDDDAWLPTHIRPHLKLFEAACLAQWCGEDGSGLAFLDLAPVDVYALAKFIRHASRSTQRIPTDAILRPPAT